MPEVVSDSLNDFKKMLESCKLEGAYNDDLVFDNNGNTRTSWWALQSFFYVGRGLELKHMQKGEIRLPWNIFFNLRDGLAAGAFNGAAGVGKPWRRAASALSLRLW
jgi:hypothetical protein